MIDGGSAAAAKRRRIECSSRGGGGGTADATGGVRRGVTYLVREVRSNAFGSTFIMSSSSAPTMVVTVECGGVRGGVRGARSPRGRRLARTPRHRRNPRESSRANARRRARRVRTTRARRGPDAHHSRVDARSRRVRERSRGRGGGRTAADMSSGKGDSRLPRDFTRHPRRRRFGPERPRERATSLAKPLERFERAPKDVASARRSARALWCRDARASGVVIGERCRKKRGPTRPPRINRSL